MSEQTIMQYLPLVTFLFTAVGAYLLSKHQAIYEQKKLPVTKKISFIVVCEVRDREIFAKVVAKSNVDFDMTINHVPIPIVVYFNCSATDCTHYYLDLYNMHLMARSESSNGFRKILEHSESLDRVRVAAHAAVSLAVIDNKVNHFQPDPIPINYL